jgi:flagellar hook assembly protein FlgD
MVISLLDENQHSGYHSLKWNGKNGSGIALPSGVYYCQVEAGENKAVQKMLLVR